MQDIDSIEKGVWDPVQIEGRVLPRLARPYRPVIPDLHGIDSGEGILSEIARFARKTQVCPRLALQRPSR
jgi:hypothetical protein